MPFERPAALLLLALPLVAALARLLFPGTVARAFPLSASRGSFSRGRGARAWLDRASSLSFWLAFAAGVLALAGPGAGERKRFYLERGPEIMFAIDVSPSMAADHGGRSRLEASLSLVRDLASSGGNASLGVIAFASETALVSPPTEDRAYLLSRLASLKPGMLGEGTDLGLGMAGALFGVERSRAPSRLAVVITDGEDNERSVSPERAAELFARSGTPLMILGIGRAGESGIEYLDPETGESVRGVYVSGFDERRLETVARAAGGTFLRADSPEALPRARAELLGDAAPTGSFRESAPGSGLALPLAAVSFALLALSRIIALAAGTGP